MANDINLMKETITTKQSFPGPNKTLAQTKNVTCATDIEVHGDQTDVPAQYRFLDLVGYLNPSLVGAGPYADSPLMKAGVGSYYRHLIVTAGVVTGANLYIKGAETGAAADWKLVAKAA